MAKTAQGIDAVIKLLVQGGSDAVRQMKSPQVGEWLNVELPRTQSKRVDLLGRTKGGGLLHIELQSQNDPSMPLRMAEYAVAILRRYGEYPEQIVLYVGNDKMRMKGGLRHPGMISRYRLLDIREFDSAALLASPLVADNILAVLAGLGDTTAGLRTILRKIMGLEKSQREPAFQRLSIACAVRRLTTVVEEELHTMPVTFDLTEDPYIFKLVEKGRLEGMEKGMEKGLEKGLEAGLKANRKLIRTLVEKRFGLLPASTLKRLDSLSEVETSEIGLKLFDASNLAELFGPQHEATPVKKRIRKTPSAV